MLRNPVWIRILLWIGVVSFLLCFLASTVAPERVLPVIGLSEPQGFIIRLYGIFQLSWAVLFIFALQDVEKNLAIINSAIITGILVSVFFVVYKSAAIRSGRYLLFNAALVFVYSGLLFLCKPRPAQPEERKILKSRDV